MYDNILVPFDGTEEAQKGAKHAVDLAASVGATVHALYVIDLPGTPRTVYIRDDEEEMRAEYENYGEEVTSEVCDMAAERDVDCAQVLQSGAIHEEIVEYAEDNPVDLIVMGSAYRGALGMVFGGNVERVVRGSSVPVTTVRMRVDE
jgi:nucleotide-binding universal stress UspA family protein